MLSHRLFVPLWLRCVCCLTEHVEVWLHIWNDDGLDGRVSELGQSRDASIVCRQALVRIQPSLQQCLGDARLQLWIARTMLHAHELEQISRVIAQSPMILCCLQTQLLAD